VRNALVAQARLREQLESENQRAAALRQTLKLADGTTIKFPIDPFARYCLLNGVDELGYLRSQEAAIARYEQASA
jgi:3-isopropylmalate dehydratase small subunit